MEEEKKNIDIESEKSEQAEKKETDWKEKFLRVSADYQNFKRRTEKDRIQWVLSAQVKVVKTLLPVFDELALAIDSGKKHDVSEEWLKGFEMIQKNMNKRFIDLGIKEIDCSGKFNPDLHEALMQVDSDKHEPGDVVDVLAPGYILGDEVVRHAKVSVAK